MYYRKLLLRISIFLLAMIVANHGLYANISNTSAFVLTITAPVNESGNGSQFLFNKLRLMVGKATQNNSLAGILEKVGGSWALTSDMSCIQLAVIFPSENEKVINGIYNFVTDISIFKLDASHIKDASAYSVIFSNCATKCDWNWNEEITFNSKGLSSNFTKKIASILDVATFRSELFSGSKKWQTSLTVKDEMPMMASIFSWDKISITNFISAKVIGEKYLCSFKKAEFVKYRIWTLPGKLFLVLTIQGSEKLIVDNLQKINEFNQGTEKLEISKTDEWRAFSSTSIKILTEDYRDVMKANLYAGWYRHWTNAEYVIPEEVDFVAPHKVDQIFVMPEASMHQSSYSCETSVGFIGHKHITSKGLIDVVIAIQTDDISIVKQAFDGIDNMVFPVTLKEAKDNLLLVAFCANTVGISNMLQIVKSKIDSLKLNGNTEIAVAAVGSIAPFILKNKLQLQWNPKKKKYSWQEATVKDIAVALNTTLDDEEALHGKYLLRIASSRGRAELLAILASNHKQLKSFNKFLK